MTDPRDDQSTSAAEREGIVDQQDAALAAIDEHDSDDEHAVGDDPIEGEAPTG